MLGIIAPSNQALRFNVYLRGYAAKKRVACDLYGLVAKFSQAIHSLTTGFCTIALLKKISIDHL
jgi:hypothetical protein